MSENRARKYATVVGIIAGLTMAGIGISAAQQSDDSSSTPPTTTAAPKDAPNFKGPGPEGRPFKRELGDHGLGPGFGAGKFGGPGAAIHGEFVVPKADGGYRTIATQRGEVTDVSSSSITVKSADGFTKKYSVDENTLVNSGRDGIGNVKKGDKVAVEAVVDGGAYQAMHIADETNLGSIHDHWNPKPAAPSGGSGSTTKPTA